MVLLKHVKEVAVRIQQKRFEQAYWEQKRTWYQNGRDLRLNLIQRWGSLVCLWWVACVSLGSQPCNRWLDKTWKKNCLLACLWYIQFCTWLDLCIRPTWEISLSRYQSVWYKIKPLVFLPDMKSIAERLTAKQIVLDRPTLKFWVPHFKSLVESDNQVSWYQWI